MVSVVGIVQVSCPFSSFPSGLLPSAWSVQLPCGLTCTTGRTMDVACASAVVFWLAVGCTYAPTAKAQGSRVRSHDAVLAPSSCSAFVLTKAVESNSSRDVRVRVRPTVVRVRTSETAIRAVVRVAAHVPQLYSPFAYPAHGLGRGFLCVWCFWGLVTDGLLFFGKSARLWFHRTCYFKLFVNCCCLKNSL